MGNVLHAAVGVAAGAETMNAIKRRSVLVLTALCLISWAWPATAQEPRARPDLGLDRDDAGFGRSDRALDLGDGLHRGRCGQTARPWPEVCRAAMT